MPSAQLALFPTFLEEIIAQAISTTPLYLGIILPANYVNPDFDIDLPFYLVTAEYASYSWTRPTVTLASNGSYNTTTDRWSIPPTTAFSVTAPAGGLEIKQAFVLIGGTSTPGNTTGIMIGVATYAIPLSLAAAETKVINFNLDLFAAA